MPETDLYAELDKYFPPQPHPAWCANGRHADTGPCDDHTSEAVTMAATAGGFFPDGNGNALVPAIEANLVQDQHGDVGYELRINNPLPEAMTEQPGSMGAIFTQRELRAHIRQCTELIELSNWRAA